MKGEENTVMRDYVLPDFSSIKKGFCKVRKHQNFQYCHCEFLLQRHRCGAVPCSILFFFYGERRCCRFSVHQPREEMVYSGKYKTGEQILRLANERFAVPEILFHPSDIGIQEMGIPEAIVHSVQSLPEGLCFLRCVVMWCTGRLLLHSYKRSETLQL